MSDEGRWRVWGLIREAASNVWVSWARTAFLGSAMAFVVAGLILSEIRASSELLGFHEGFVAAGGNVVVAQSDAPVIPGEVCDLLNSEVYVAAAGSYRSLAPEALLTSPNNPYSRGAITVPVAGILWPDAPVGHPGQIVVGRATTVELALREGSWLTLDHGRARVAATPAAEGRWPVVERSILHITAPSEFFEACVVELVSGASAGVAVEALQAMFPLSVEVAPMVQLGAFAQDPAIELRQRSERQMWWAGALLLVLVGSIQSWTRRAELALYRVVGTRRTELYLLLWFEAFMVLTAAAVGSVSWSLAGWATYNGIPNADQLAIAGRSIGSLYLGVLVVLPLVSLTATLGTIATHLKER